MYCSTRYSLLYLVNLQSWVISDFCCGANEICAVLVFYERSNGNFIPTFQDNLSAQSSKAKLSKKTALPSKAGQISCPDTSIKNCHLKLRKIQKRAQISCSKFL
jgi:hypothetical protein